MIEILKTFIVLIIFAFVVYQIYKLVIEIRAKFILRNKKNNNVVVPDKTDDDKNLKK